MTTASAEDTRPLPCAPVNRRPGVSFSGAEGPGKGEAGPCTVSLGPFSLTTIRIRSEKGKGRETGRRKATDLRSPSSHQDEGREVEARAAGLPKSYFGVLQPLSSKLKAAVFC